MTKRRKLAYFALLINTLVWGAAAPIVKPALSFITPSEFLFLRFLLATILTLPFAIFLIRKERFGVKDIGLISVLELIGTTLILWMTYTALDLTTAIEVSLIYSTAPVFVTLAGIIFLGEKQTRTEWKGLILAIFGTLVITVGPFIQTGGFEGLGSLVGNSLMLAQNLVWAGYLVLAKKIYRTRSKLAVTVISFWIGTLSFFFLTLPLPHGEAFSTLLRDISAPAVILAVVYMAVFGSIIGATTYLVGQNLIEISEASVFTYLQPVVAVPLSILWLGESLTWLTLVGIIMIASGVYLTEFKR